MKRTDGIRRARRAAARSLVKALAAIPADSSENLIARSWSEAISHEGSIYPFGWYQPPPKGMSILIGLADDSYNRLAFTSLRDKPNWPSADVKMSKEGILYPYFSAIDSQSGLIGDFVGTFYRGENQELRDWIRSGYQICMSIAEAAQVGMPVCDLYQVAMGRLASVGSTNNTFSVAQGDPAGADIGHTIPGFGISYEDWQLQSLPEAAIVQKVAEGRVFLRGDSNERIAENMAFTVEPQILRDDLPVVGFHVIVAFEHGEKSLITEFDPVFDYFGMLEWIR